MLEKKFIALQQTLIKRLSSCAFQSDRTEIIVDSRTSSSLLHDQSEERSSVVPVVRKRMNSGNQRGEFHFFNRSCKRWFRLVLHCTVFCVRAGFPTTMHPEPVIRVEPGVVFKARSASLGDGNDIFFSRSRFVIDLYGLENYFYGSIRLADRPSWR